MNMCSNTHAYIYIYIYIYIYTHINLYPMPCGPTPPPRLQLKNRVKNHAKIHQNGSQIGPRGSRFLVLRASWRPLGVAGGQLGSKMVSRPQKWKFWPPLGGHLGGQNRSNIDFKIILKVRFFMFLWIDFWHHLEPTTGHLGPTWYQLEVNLSQLETNLGDSVAKLEAM